MELSLLLQLYAWNCYGSLVIGLALNFLLLFVAKKCSSSGLREYRRVVFQFSVLNILFLIVQVLNQPLILTANANNNFMYVLFSGPIAQIPSYALWIILDIVYFTLANLLMAGLAMQFVERYLVICRNHQNAFCRNLFLCGILCFYCVFSMFSQIMGMQNGVNLEDLNEPIFAGAINLTKYIKIVCHYDPANSTMTCIYIGIIGFMLFCYLAIIICYQRIRTFLKANMQTDVVHGVNRKTLKNIIWSMLIQAFVPSYSIAIGVFTICLSIVTNAGSIFGQYFLVSFAFLNWLPLLNPLVTILTIDEYRRGTLGIFKRHQQNQTTPIMPFVIF